MEHPNEQPGSPTIQQERQARFDFDTPAGTSGSGSADLFPEREAAFRRVNERFGAMVGERVRLKLFAWDVEYTGKLALDTLLIPESKGDAVPLRIGKVAFDLRDIEYCLRDQSL